MIRDLTSTLMDYALPCFMILSNCFAVLLYLKLAIRSRETRKWTILLTISALLFSIMSLSTMAISLYPIWKSLELRYLAVFVVILQQLSGFLGCMFLMLGAWFLVKLYSVQGKGDDGNLSN